MSAIRKFRASLCSVKLCLSGIQIANSIGLVAYEVPQPSGSQSSVLKRNEHKKTVLKQHGVRKSIKSESKKQTNPHRFLLS